jgi:hypothetical protein
MRVGIDFEKKLKKGMLAAAYKGLQDENLKHAVLAEYKALYATHECSDKMLEKHLLNAILPAIAFYGTLKRSGCAPGDAIDMIRVSVLAAAEPMAKLFRTMGRLPFFFPVLRVMAPLSVRASFGESGWAMEWHKNTHNEITFTAHSCFYDCVLRQYGAPELTRLFCECDDVIYGHIPKVAWGRTKTIGRGGDACDFRFDNERRAKKTRPRIGKG